MPSIGKRSHRKQKSLGLAFLKAVKSFATSLPVIVGVVLLLGLFRVYVSAELISSVFKGGVLGDVFAGTIIGSISAGNPITSYIIGAELLKEGVSLFAVAAFIIAWVNVGFIQFPAEASILGKRFALARNILSFLLAGFVSAATVIVLSLFG